MLLSQVALAEGDLGVSSSAARSARRQLVRQGRSRWAALARFSEAQSRWAAGSAQSRVPREAGALAGVLGEQEWLLPSLECRLIGARAALLAGDMDTVQSLVAGSTDVRVRAVGAANARMVRRGTGPIALNDRPGALSALRSGLKVAQDYRATLGPPSYVCELRRAFGARRSWP